MPEMDWSRLLSDFRIGRAKQNDREEHRLPWQTDYDRITFSSAFRRLQDKTQVFPLSSSDYVRTRLTHSMEAAAVAKSLGGMVGCLLREKKRLHHIHPIEIGMIVSAAALAHDIGNPPFGHSGEDAIQTWFQNSKTVQQYAPLADRERADLANFEGNAQGFRIIMRLQMYKEKGGMQLTAATLGAFSKYPVQARLEREPEEKAVNLKKFGFFQSEKDRFGELAERLGLLPESGSRGGWCRHPLAFLVEAADDICYRIVDFEDGYQQGLIDFKTATNCLARIGKKKRNLTRALAEPTNRDTINVLRSQAIGSAVEATAKAFMRHLGEIMRGELKQSLLETTRLHDAFDAIKELQVKHIYRDQRVLRVEAAGFKVLGGLLEALFKATCEVAEAIEKDGDDKGAPKESRKLVDLIPTEFLGAGRAPGKDAYERLLGVTDYVCGMTDSFALNLYRNISGISLP